jgi:NADH-quinone oxidoreductase subunit J
MTTVLFWILAVATGVSAISVVVSQNIVRSAVWLLFTLGGTAGIFFLLGADFVGAVQLFVYVGGTLVLVVFGVMLTAQGPFINMKTGAAEWAMTTVVGLSLFTVLAVSVWPKTGSEDAALVANPQMDDPYPTTKIPKDPKQPQGPKNEVPVAGNAELLGQSLLGLTSATPTSDLAGLPSGAHVASVPHDRHQVSYLLPFEIVSIHLLVVLIGAAYLARAKRRRGGVA